MSAWSTPLADLQEYRNSSSEIARTNDLLQLLPSVRRTVLDVGARDGHFSRLLTGKFESVTALDLTLPRIEHPAITCVQGDVTHLQFADNSFDCVLCAEVLEHVPNLDAACRELQRVTRHEIIIGVPFRQDTRVGRTTCSRCGKSNPPYGHINSFTEARLVSLFPGFEVEARSFTGSSNEVTNAVSVLLMDLAGNPWGTYSQDEPCIYCGEHMTAPVGVRPLWSRLSTACALALNSLQQAVTSGHPNWIHLVFRKRNS